MDPKKDPIRRCMREHEWPAPDLGAWRKATQKSDVLIEDGKAAGWSPKMTKTVIQSYGRWLTWLERRGLLDPQDSPANRVTPEVLSGYIEELRKLNASLTVRNRILNLYFALRAMAPDHDWAWMLPVTSKLRRAVVPARDKQSRVVETDQLLALGLELMDSAETAATSLKRAARFQNGLMIALLSLRPVRRANLTSMGIGVHLLVRKGEYFIHFDGPETKNGHEIDSWLPDILIPRVEEYLTVHRERLLQQRVKTRHTVALERERTNALWISSRGGALSEGAIYGRMIRATKAKFGAGISPHLFRDCAATTIARRDPGRIHITKSVLGHSTIATSERHYNHARSLQASRKYSEILELRRKSGSSETKNP